MSSVSPPAVPQRSLSRRVGRLFCCGCCSGDPLAMQRLDAHLEESAAAPQRGRSRRSRKKLPLSKLEGVQLDEGDPAPQLWDGSVLSEAEDNGEGDNGVPASGAGSWDFGVPDFRWPARPSSPVRDEKSGVKSYVDESSAKELFNVTLRKFVIPVVRGGLERLLRSSLDSEAGLQVGGSCSRLQV